MIALLVTIAALDSGDGELPTDTRYGGQLSLVAAFRALTVGEEAASFVLLPLARARLVPPPAPTEAACIACEDVLMLLRNDRLAVPMLKLGLPPLKLLNQPTGKMNLPILVVPSGKKEFWRWTRGQM